MIKNQENKSPLYYLTWNTTCRCNLRCKHCYNDSFKIMEKETLTFEEFLKTFCGSDF